MKNASLLLKIFTLVSITSSCKEPNKNSSNSSNYNINRSSSRDSNDNNNNNNNNNNNATPSILSILSSQRHIDNIPIHIDTSFKTESFPIAITLTHEKIEKSYINIPKKYLSPFSTKTYKANDLYSMISYKYKNINKIIKINKTLFIDSLPIPLKKYGQLRSPNLSYDSKKGLVYIRYSISIPLTDIGQPVSVIIDRNGNKKISF